MGEEEEEEEVIRRNKPRKKDPKLQPPTISSLISTNDDENKKKKIKIKKYLTISSRFRGLGCTTGHPQVVSVPAIIRTSANWHDPPKPITRKIIKNCISNSNSNSNSSGDQVGGDVNLWCGPPGIGFSTDAVSSSSVDCVVSRPTTTDIIRLRGSYGGRRMVHPEDLPFFDTDSRIPHPHRSFGARHHRHLRHHHRSHEGLAEIARIQGNLLMGGRLDDDQYRDWRLDVDDMSYEELLALGDKIGYVCTGLKEDEIRRCVRKTKPMVVSEDKSSSRIQTETHSKCTICQEEFEGDDEIGKLDCGHFYHMICIKQWLGQKKTCPICKVVVNAQQ